MANSDWFPKVKRDTLGFVKKIKKDDCFMIAAVRKNNSKNPLDLVVHTNFNLMGMNNSDRLNYAGCLLGLAWEQALETALEVCRNEPERSLRGTFASLLYNAGIHMMQDADEFKDLKKIKEDTKEQE